MGKPAQYEGATIDGYQQQQCGPRSALEIWRSPTGGSTPLVEEATCHSNDFSFVVAPIPVEDVQEEWSNVSGLEPAQIHSLQALAAKGIYWEHPDHVVHAVFSLHHGGDVEADGNCLFTASQKAMRLEESPLEVRLRTVRRFLEDYENDLYNQEQLNATIRHLYAPNLSVGWGVHWYQELKFLAKKEDRESLDCSIAELVGVGMPRDQAAESIYKERCIPVDDAESWAKYMSIAGTGNEEYDIITLSYLKDGLMSVDDNREGRAAAFGDDIAIECLANEFEREIFVVQAHGSDAMVDESDNNNIFYLPHRPRSVSSIRYPPMFLFMKGTGWCGAGGDHYEPIVARLAPCQVKEKAAATL
ncbi:hypothetical protein MPTK1_2g09140 [Marchantia polymorpha subsp. ruderalis]|uniref:OTU domain-containing protein n=2 Tax=Marchantia polymorpha TaxID=3197 RepID=A0A176VH94_MARPO|nr:hypothetical protein AXG93_909s1150 [Marchantia polymorpha subsp. ruderalis]PTQ45418.1 hypothetical protein MARPO_0015s0197 [Marchantia polymorpha]BBN01652.1 hypothetical protein Mp_2g09140 [Marchantia polymorpha subsp. ruderalis]|eukprot:PTQ45418.1 hypothetical protein MARPO_0015s0197 [Marchantia polymorpha]